MLALESVKIVVTEFVTLIRKRNCPSFILQNVSGPRFAWAFNCWRARFGFCIFSASATEQNRVSDLVEIQCGGLREREWASTFVWKLKKHLSGWKQANWQNYCERKTPFVVYPHLPASQSKCSLLPEFRPSVVCCSSVGESKKWCSQRDREFD
jgi:hypothetical protein